MRAFAARAQIALRRLTADAEVVLLASRLGIGRKEQLIEQATEVANTLLAAPFLLQYPTEVLACACLAMAANTLKVQLGEGDKWWRQALSQLQAAAGAALRARNPGAKVEVQPGITEPDFRNLLERITAFVEEEQEWLKAEEKKKRTAGAMGQRQRAAGAGGGAAPKPARRASRSSVSAQTGKRRKPEGAA